MSMLLWPRVYTFNRLRSLFRCYGSIQDMPFHGVTGVSVGLVCSYHLAQLSHFSDEETEIQTEKGRVVEDFICVR